MCIHVYIYICISYVYMYVCIYLCIYIYIIYPNLFLQIIWNQQPMASACSARWVASLCSLGNPTSDWLWLNHILETVKTKLHHAQPADLQSGWQPMKLPKIHEIQTAWTAPDIQRSFLIPRLLAKTFQVCIKTRVDSSPQEMGKLIGFNLPPVISWFFTKPQGIVDMVVSWVMGSTPVIIHF